MNKIHRSIALASCTSFIIRFGCTVPIPNINLLTFIFLLSLYFVSILAWSQSCSSRFLFAPNILTPSYISKRNEQKKEPFFQVATTFHRFFRVLASTYHLGCKINNGTLLSVRRVPGSDREQKHSSACIGGCMQSICFPCTQFDQTAVQTLYYTRTIHWHAQPVYTCNYVHIIYIYIYIDILYMVASLCLSHLTPRSL
jgi:hypothetical protein